MNDDGINSYRAIVQFWAPIEVLLRERYPNRDTGERIRALSQAGANRLFLDDLRWLIQQRNKHSHPPYEPIQNIPAFCAKASQVLRGLQGQRDNGDGPVRKSARPRQAVPSGQPVASKPVRQPSQSPTTTSEDDDFAEWLMHELSPKTPTPEQKRRLQAARQEVKYPGHAQFAPRHCPHCGEVCLPREETDQRGRDSIWWCCDECRWYDFEDF